ncbi:MAG: CCA tRNA nucleotidyltransferase [Candidatus Altiarchaeota archaeon]
MKFLDDVIADITPSPGEKKKTDAAISEVSAELKKLGVTPVLVGSVAKGTDLIGETDVDLFIPFPSDTKPEELESHGLDVGKKLFKNLKTEYEIDYAEHPYVKGVYKGIVFEIVPFFGSGKFKTSVDRTPLHTKFIMQKEQSGKIDVGQVRLLKKFMKSQNVYGAEAKVMGFSGYLVELLVFQYGSFVDVLKAASDWKYGEVIDPAGLWEDRSALNYYFTGADLVVVDPVDQDRNVAAAVSREKMSEFMVFARGFLAKPSKEWFFPPEKIPPSIDELLVLGKGRGTHLVAIEIIHPKLNVNTLYGQLRRTLKSIAETVESDDFEIFKSGFWSNESDFSILLFEFEVWELPPLKRVRGPPIDTDIVNQDKFLEKYSKNNPYVEGGFWFVDGKRKFILVDELLLYVIGSKAGFGKDLRLKGEFGLETLKGLFYKRKDKGILIYLEKFLKN